MEDLEQKFLLKQGKKSQKVRIFSKDALRNTKNEKKDKKNKRNFDEKEKLFRIAKL